MKIQGMSIGGYQLILQDNGKELKRHCTSCGEKKPVSEFGLRLMTDKKEIRIQAQCTVCRGDA